MTGQKVSHSAPSSLPEPQALWCVGRNYADHAKELGNAVPSEPLIFLKSPATRVPLGTPVRLPEFTSNVHHELELALQYDPSQPHRVSHFTLALDLTARDVQTEAKKKGEPWTLAKSFKSSCPIGFWLRFTDWQDFDRLQFQLRVNGEVRQNGRPTNMIFSGPKIIDYLEARYPLVPGDIILTGTPEGVAPVRRGDRLECELLGNALFVWDFV